MPNCIISTKRIIRSMSHEKVKVVSEYVYCAGDILGTGTWGSVFLAKHRETGEQVALKKMNKFKVQASEKSFQKYQSQVMSLQKASQIHQVIRILDFFKSKANYYIVTEYFQGSLDLYNYMLARKNKFCEDEARGIWHDLLIGIGELHAMGIYHRDLKLQNVVYLAEQRRAKIIDFGMATCFPEPEGVVGSPMFMSPQVLGNSKYTHKCDIWSLGIIFFCMVFRTSPYGDTVNTKLILEKMKKFKSEGIPFPHDVYISSHCKQVIAACLQYQEKDRPEISFIAQMPFFRELEIPSQAFAFYQPSTAFKP